MIGGLRSIRVSLVDTETFATIESADVAVDSAVLGIAIGPRPPQASGLTAVTVNNDVTLAWTIAASRGLATEQVVEAGFASGQTAGQLTVPAGATSLTVPNVPPGRYYVRVRSVNGTGVGAPSNEVIVDVP